MHLTNLKIKIFFKLATNKISGFIDLFICYFYHQKIDSHTNTKNEMYYLTHHYICIARCGFEKKLQFFTLQNVFEIGN